MIDVLSDRFTSCLSVDEIRKIITVKPDPVRELSSVEALVASEILSVAIKEIFIPTVFSINFIREAVGRARLHHEKIFESYVKYIAGIYTPADTEVTPICLTGLAGVGKSQTISALRKVLPLPMKYSCEHYTDEIELSSYWYKSARGKVSGKSLLAGFIYGNESSSRTTVDKILLECRRRAWRDGVSLLMLDETQHINTGLSSAKVTDILLSMAAIGPPMVYVCNYSLVHKLRTRNSEDIQRLLAEPRVMFPDDPQSSDWRDYIEECIRVSNGAIKASLLPFAEEVYRCTFGVKRLVVQLLKQAYVECRLDGRYQVELSDLSTAYRSISFSSSADEVQELQRQAISNVGSNRADLKCPFHLPKKLRSNVVLFAKEERQQRYGAKVIDSALSSKERSTLKAINDTKPPEQKPKAPRKPPAQRLTPEQQADAFAEYMNSTVSPGKGKTLEDHDG